MTCGLRRYVKHFLSQTGFRPRKRRGQSFLVDCRVAEKVAEEAAAEEVYEIGVGLGSLTFYLSRTSSHVVGVEIEEKLARYTRENLGIPNLDLIVADALKIVPGRHVESVASSVPYSISSPLIVHLCRNVAFTKAVLILQKEFAERLLAKPGAKNYGRISVLSSLCFTTEKLFNVSRKSFLPSPEVDSVALRLSKKALSPSTLEAVEKVTGKLFTYRRRLLRSALKKAYPGAQPPPSLENRRVYQITPQEFLLLAKTLEGAT